MNLDKLRATLRKTEQERYDEAVHDLAECREMMDLEPLDEPLHHMTLVGYEVVDGIGQERQRISGWDWPDFIHASDAVEATADCAFYRWLEGMNLRFEATRLDTPSGYPSNWYVTAKVLTLAKLTWGGA